MGSDQHRAFYEALVDTHRDEALVAIERALASGLSAQAVLLDIVVPALEQLGSAVLLDEGATLAQHFLASQIAGAVAESTPLHVIHTEREQDQVVLIVCGLFRKEVQHLVETRGWPVTTRYLDSALHIDFDKLQEGIEGAFAAFPERDTVLVYGTCHPLMDEIVDSAHSLRTPGQNCVELALGRERFTEELADGSFFLFEDWAKRFDRVVLEAMGFNPQVMREEFRMGHRRVLAIRTPCSGDFTDRAEAFARLVDLPLTWIEIDLTHLEAAIQAQLDRAWGRDDP